MLRAMGRRRSAGPWLPAFLAIVLAGCGFGADRVGPTGTTSGGPSPTASPSPPELPSAATRSCSPAALDLPPGGAWWNDRVFYEVFVRSFGDADGDGIGDLRGLIDHLDDLNDGDPTTDADLGIDGLWLMPVFEATSYHGYDTTDYRGVEPDYGSLDDLRALVEAAHARGMAVILDLALNHTSSEHPWFRASAAGDQTYADWYRWQATDPGWPAVAGGPPWHRLGTRFYYGAFGPGMPDLNLESPAVTAELTDVARFWITEVGVDGYRLDAVKHLIEEGPDRQVNTASTRAWLRAFRAAVHERAPAALLLGEVWDISSVSARYVAEGALDLAFDFPLAAGMVGALRLGDRAPLAGVAAEVAERYPAWQVATFLTNHDQTRVASELGGNPGALRAAASLLLTGPGVPFVYYGEEIGIAGRKPDERLRVPMPWSAERPGGGFSRAEPWQPFGDDWPTVTVAAQRDDPASLLSHYRRLVRVRAANPALRRGDAFLVEASSSAVWSTLRSDGAEAVLVVVNLGPEPQTGLRFDLEAGPLCGVTRARSLLDGGSLEPPLVTSTGGLAGYAPIERLEPYATVLIGLER